MPKLTLIKRSLTFLVSLFLLSSNTYAASAANIQVTHCADNGNNNYDCGQVLVGAARIEFGAIRWTGEATDAVNLSLQTVSQAFGFTGESLYPSDPHPVGMTTAWGYESPRRVIIDAPYNGANINYFFAPFQAGSVTASNEYVILSPSDSKTVPVVGVGVDDDPTSPALTLKVKVEVNNVETPCTYNPCPVVVSKDGDVVLFTVTPDLPPKESELASKFPNKLEPVKYLSVVLQATENSTECSRNYLTFRDQGVGPNRFNPKDYYHYLDRDGPNQTPNTCTRGYPFLISVGKSFQFQTTKSRDTGNGYVDYVFYVSGHYDAKNPNNYKGSWKAFLLSDSLQTSTTIPVVTPPVATATGTTTTTDTTNTTTLPATGTTTPPVTNNECPPPTFDLKDGSATLPCVLDNNQQQSFSLEFRGYTEKGEYFWKTNPQQESTCQNSCATIDKDSNLVIPPVKILPGGSNIENIVLKKYTPPYPNDGQYWKYTPTIAKPPINVSAIQKDDRSLTVDLLGTVSTTNTSPVYHYQWESTDKDNQPVGKTAVTFDTPGNYKINLTVTDTQGNLIDTVSQDLTVSPKPTETNYSLNLSLESGEYKAEVAKAKADSQNECFWNLQISSSATLNSSGFKAGAKSPAWTSFLLSESNKSSYYKFDSPITVNIYKDNDSNQGMLSTSLAIPGEIKGEIKLDSLKDGFYVTHLSSQDSSNPHHQSFEMNFINNGPIGGITMDSWIDSTDVGYIDFKVDSSQRVNFKLKFRGDNCAKPGLTIYKSGEIIYSPPK